MKNMICPGPLYSELARDPEYAEILEMFVDEIPNRLRHLRDACEQRDWELVARLAHQLKGSAGSYGYHPVTGPATKLEESVTSRCPEEEICKAVEELAAWCEQIRPGFHSP